MDVLSITLVNLGQNKELVYPQSTRGTLMCDEVFLCLMCANNTCFELLVEVLHGLDTHRENG